MAHLVGNTGRVIGIDHIPELVEMSHRVAMTEQPEFLESGRVKFVGEFHNIIVYCFYNF